MDIIFLVRVSCMTYNHAPYIEDAMNGKTKLSILQFVKAMTIGRTGQNSSARLTIWNYMKSALQ